MDFIKKASESFSGDKKEGSGDKKANENMDYGDKKANENMDYGDKAFDFASKKAGYNVDRSTSEKITDGAREGYEKLTGNKVSDKYSN